LILLLPLQLGGPVTRSLIPSPAMPPDPWNEHTLVFICGLHRSGTTQLHATLGTHPQISGMRDTGVPHDEGQHLQDVYPTARQHGGPGRFAFDEGAHLTETSSLATPASARRLFDRWSRHWDLSRRVLTEKSPPNLIRMRFLQALFPKARFVVIVRHPVVITLATRKLATTPWMRRTGRQAPLALAAEHWFAAHRLLLEDLPQVQRAHVLRWEDLTADPAASLARIAAFVGVDGRFETPGLDGANDQKYVEQWGRITAATRRDRETRDLRAVLRANEDLAGRFGYRADDLSALGPLSV
jgi:hypothetical protein